MARSGNWITCTAGAWTTVWDAPTLGFTYLWTIENVTIQWKRYSDGLPCYIEGSASLQAGQNTVGHGGPGAYLQLEVNPARTTLIRAT